MGSFTGYLLVYVLGGVTFVPLLLSFVFLHAYLTQRPPKPPPSEAEKDDATAKDPLRHPADDQYSLKSGTDVLAEEFKRTHESDVAAGYFAVCREYVPGGVNGKPPERTTPAGDASIGGPESPSVYQTMYRSIFERKSQQSSIEPVNNNSSGKNGRRARNVFYIVLRHGHLMLYDDAEQIEVRYVISLAHHDVSIYSGSDEVIPEGELYIRRNAICLTRRPDSIADLRGWTPPFYLFCQNQSVKEDFYHALLRNQERVPNSPDSPPAVQYYNVKDIVTLVQRLHSSEEHLQTRWINALIGRLFLALYKTPEMHDFVWKKITKKISRVPKPNFISKIGLQKIDMGHGAPFITNPRLKDLTVDGDCTVEMDVNYSGDFRIEISATARIDLGQRFKPREVDMMLAVVLKKLNGHVWLRFKPPPSNRLWVCFSEMPDMTMSIEPIVSTRQITYGIILRAIESRIREVIAETIVHPYWDDIPFLDTRSLPFRGGIWEREVSKPGVKPDIPDESGGPETSEEAPEGKPAVDSLRAKDERTVSMPEVAQTDQAPGLKLRKSSKSISSEPNPESGAISSSSSSVDKNNLGTSTPDFIRPRAWSTVADPVVTPDHGRGDKADSDSTRSTWRRKSKSKKDATSSIMEIKTRAQSLSSPPTPQNSPPKEPVAVSNGDGSTDMQSDIPRRPESVYSNTDSSGNGTPDTMSQASTNVNDEGKRNRTLDSITKSFTNSISAERRQTMAAIGSATAAAAKKWGWNVLSKAESLRNSDSGPKPGTPEHPIGRGHPLPPPGTPLPPPERASSGIKANPISVPRRKPVRPPMPSRKSVSRQESNPVFTDELLVVEAPSDSEPNSPIVAPPDGTTSGNGDADTAGSEDASSRERREPGVADDNDTSLNPGIERAPVMTSSEETENSLLGRSSRSSTATSVTPPDGVELAKPEPVHNGSLRREEVVS